MTTAQPAKDKKVASNEHDLLLLLMDNSAVHECKIIFGKNGPEQTWYGPPLPTCLASRFILDAATPRIDASKSLGMHRQLELQKRKSTYSVTKKRYPRLLEAEAATTKDVPDKLKGAVAHANKVGTGIPADGRHIPGQARTIQNRISTNT